MIKRNEKERERERRTQGQRVVRMNNRVDVFRDERSFPQK